MTELETQLDQSELSDMQDSRVDLTPDERVAAIKGIQFVRSKIAEDVDAVVGLTGLLHAVSRSYETALFQPRLELTPVQRNDQDMLIRGLRMGLNMAVEHLTDPEQGARLLSMQPTPKED